MFYPEVCVTGKNRSEPTVSMKSESTRKSVTNLWVKNILSNCTFISFWFRAFERQVRVVGHLQERVPGQHPLQRPRQGRGRGVGQRRPQPLVPVAERAGELAAGLYLMGRIHG